MRITLNVATFDNTGKFCLADQQVPDLDRRLCLITLPKANSPVDVNKFSSYPLKNKM